MALAHVDRAVHGIAPEEPLPQAIAAGAKDLFRGRDAMLLQGQRCHRLHRRSGRVQTAERLVQQRNVIIVVQHLPFDTANAGREAVGIERRHRCNRQQAAGFAVDDDHGGRFQAYAAGGIILQWTVDGQFQRLPLNVLAGFKIAHDLATGSDFHTPGARHAA